MARVVKVDLLLEAARYVRGARDAGDATDKLTDAVDDVAKASTVAAKATDHLGDELGDLARDARRLDSQIDTTKRGIRELAREIASTADEAKRADLSKKLNVEQRSLRKQTKLRDLIDVDSGGSVGEELAERVSLSFVQRLGPLIARAPMAGMNPAVLAIGAPIAAGVATLVGTAIGGAIVGAAGIGGVVGGLKLAARDPRVQAAGTALGADLSEMLGRASVSFVPEALGAIDAIGRRLDGMEGDLTTAFSAASTLVDPLVDGLLDAADNAMPGLIDAIQAAGPVIDVIGQALADFGQVVGDSLSELAPYADEGARALQVLFYVMEGGVSAAFDLIEGMSALYKVAELVGAVLAGDIPRFIALATAQDDAGSSAGDLQPMLDGLRDKFGGLGDKAGTATVQVESLNEALKRLTGENLTAEQANLRLEEAIGRATAAGKANNDGISVSTEKGRANRTALLGIAEAANTSHDAILTQTGSQELASAATARGRTAFLKSAAAMGVSKDEAIKLADKLFAIPAKVSSTVTVTANTSPALDSARGVVARINSMHARIKVSAEPSGGYGGSAHTGDGYSTGMRWGGAVEHAQTGLLRLRDAGIYSPAGPARYAFAEPATGGEAFVPRNGDPRRSLGILDQAASWYGATVRPQLAPAPVGAVAGGPSGPPEVRVFIGDQELRGMVRVEVSESNRQIKRRVAGAGR